ncbi:MAG: class I adenylate-forming enzyme family protein, partial [Gammaproteobacteria bacterium]
MRIDEILSRNALRFPSRLAFAMGDAEQSWAQTEQRVARLAGSLGARGLRRGDRVAILLPNCIEYFELYFACARAGLIAVPLNYRLTPPEMAQILGLAEPALFMIGAAYHDRLPPLRELLPGLCPGCTVGEAEFESLCTGEGPLLAEGDTPDTDTFAIFFTSGTTGLPKGAMVSHLNLEMNGYNQAIADASRREDLNLVSSPVYHMGAVFMAVTYMMLGCAQLVLPAFEAGEWLATLARRRATVSLLIPTMINAILNHPDCERADTGSLRLVFYGGGPMPPAVLERA